MILVTGATGNLGKATVHSLLNAGTDASNIAALVRDESKATALKEKGIQVRLGDYEDAESLTNAFRGVDKLLLVSSSADIIHRFYQHQTVIDAAKAAGVSHIVYTGFNMQDLKHSSMAKDVDYHAYTADYLKQSGVPYTVMNNTFYADLIQIIGGKNILQNGITIPAGNGKVPFLPIAEMANTLAAVLSSPGHENREYTIAADTAYSFADIANMLSDITGKTIPYHPVEIEAYVAQLIEQGVSQDDAEYLSRYAVAIARGEFETNTSNVQQLLGRPAMGLTDYLRSVYHQ